MSVLHRCWNALYQYIVSFMYSVNILYRILNLQAGKTVKEKGNWEEQIEPYRSENAKLVRENNDLHLQVIRLKDELDATSKDLKVLCMCA